jgi:sulfite exporter TauE/SafE
MAGSTPSSVLLLGLLGTAHCIGMCGPLVLALPTAAGGARAHALYHLGRIVSYALVAAVLGGIGAAARSLAGHTGAAPMASIARFQLGLSLAAALLLLGMGLRRLGVVREPRWLAGPTPTRLPGFARLTRGAVGGRTLALLPLGLLLGLLPCGQSYAAFAAALPSGGLAEGALLGLAFGLGTLPGLLLLGTAASRLARRHQRLLELGSGLLLVGMAVRMVLDGLSGLV